MPAWETLTEMLPGLATGVDRCGACGCRVERQRAYCADCDDDRGEPPATAAVDAGPSVAGQVTRSRRGGR